MKRKADHRLHEVELKPELPADLTKGLACSPALRDHLRRRKGLKSVYFDTPRPELRRAGYSLRVRRDGRRTGGKCGLSSRGRPEVDSYFAS